MRRTRHIITLGVYVYLSILLLGSCTELSLPYQAFANEISQPPMKQSAPDPDAAELLLQYYYGLNSLPEGEIQRELDQAWQVAAREPTRLDRLRLILLLSLPRESIQDRERARALLQDFLKAENAGNTDSLDNLALLLQGFLIEDAHQEHRYRLLREKLEQKEEQIRRLRIGLEYLDGQRKQEQEWAASLEQKLANEQGKTQTLKQQLEALKTIEKRLEHRSQPKETLELPEQSEDLDE